MDARHFGSTWPTYDGLGDFRAQAQGSSYNRWPDGTRGERASDVADTDDDGCTYDHLFDPMQDDVPLNEGKRLSDILNAACEVGATLLLFLPTIRYLDDPDAAAEAAHSFVTKLLKEARGGNGASSFEITIELGIETLDGSLARAHVYGVVADAQLGVIRKVLSKTPTDIDLDIALQIGRSATKDAAIRSEIKSDNLGAIDALVLHNLPSNNASYNIVLPTASNIDAGNPRFTRGVDYVHDWQVAVALTRETAHVELDLLASAWTVGSADVVDGLDQNFQDFDARQARTTIDTFAELVGAGVDSASLWGATPAPIRTRSRWTDRMAPSWRTAEEPST